MLRFVSLSLIPLLILLAAVAAPVTAAEQVPAAEVGDEVESVPPLRWHPRAPPSAAFCVP